MNVQSNPSECSGLCILVGFLSLRQSYSECNCSYVRAEVQQDGDAVSEGRRARGVLASGQAQELACVQEHRVDLHQQGNHSEAHVQTGQQGQREAGDHLRRSGMGVRGQAWKIHTHTDTQTCSFSFLSFSLSLLHTHTNTQCERSHNDVSKGFPYSTCVTNLELWRYTHI